MKKLLLLAALSVAFVFPTLASAEDSGLYLGIGGSYTWDNFDGADDDLYGLDMDFDGGLGVRLQGGYQFNSLLSIQFDLDFVQGLEMSDSVFIEGVPVTLDAEMDLITYTVAAKLSFDMDSDVAKPFILAGVGAISGDLKATGSAMGVSVSESYSESDLCAKFGGGIDFFTTENVSLGVEGSYVLGFGDMDEIKFFSLTAGVTYHF